MDWAGLDSSSRWANQTKMICKNLRRRRDGSLCRRYLQLGSLEVQFRYCIVPQLDTVEEQAVAVPFEDLLKSRLSYVHSKSPFRKKAFWKVSYCSSRGWKGDEIQLAFEHLVLLD